MPKFTPFKHEDEDVCIRMTRKQFDKLAEILAHYEDEGPGHGEGWCSLELLELRELFPITY
jgi:hypothetical protein